MWFFWMYLGDVVMGLRMAVDHSCSAVLHEASYRFTQILSTKL